MAKNKAAEALAFAREVAADARDWIEVHNALFGIGGRLTQLFPTEAERVAFSKTDAFDQINATIQEVRDRTGDGAAGSLADTLARANGAMSIRLPKSLHAALLLEAEAEGVSLNQLCVVKLAVQLRAAIAPAK